MKLTQRCLWKSGEAGAGTLTKEILSQLRTKFYSEPRNLQAQNVCSRVDPLEACISRKCIETTNHIFKHKIETEGKPVTNQKSSGRCWLFATMNVIRVPFMKQHNLEEFEFSQSYLFFWDKVYFFYLQLTFYRESWFRMNRFHVKNIFILSSIEIILYLPRIINNDKKS